MTREPGQAKPVPRKAWWQHYAPGYAKNPFRLAWRLLTEKKPAARSAMFMAAAGIGLTPLDLALSSSEKRIYRHAPQPGYPIILVCGPPRSGTTLVGQFLINVFDVGYLNNLTSLFPRSPISSNDLFGRWLGSKRGDYEAFYGKSRGLSGANDALYIWDRWLGADRQQVPTSLPEGAEEGMRRFFGAIQAREPLPIVNKVNRLNTCAGLVTDALPQATVICLRRDPVMLAQSLYIARRDLIGDLGSVYGVVHPDRAFDDPIEDICRQITWFEQLRLEHERSVGKDRFVSLCYEEFCARPTNFVDQLQTRLPGLRLRETARLSGTSFDVSDARRLPEDILVRFERRLENVARI